MQYIIIYITINVKIWAPVYLVEEIPEVGVFASLHDTKSMDKSVQNQRYIWPEPQVLIWMSAKVAQVLKSVRGVGNIDLNITCRPVQLFLRPLAPIFVVVEQNFSL